MRNNLQFLTRAALLLALAVVFPLVGLPQPITGIAVNTILYLATALVSPLAGIIIGCLTPWVALLRGVLPPPLLIAAPFIMLGNIVLVLAFHYLRQKHIFLGIAGASLAKFFLLLLGAKFFLGYLLHLPAAVLHKTTLILGLPQFFTALAAGILVSLILQCLPGKYLWENQRRYYTIN